MSIDPNSGAQVNQPSVRRDLQYFWYMAGVVTFVVPQGIQTILFPWLVAVQLQESPARLGIAQMTMQIPGLLLILFGGWLADRVDRRRILIVLHVIASFPALLLAAALYLDYLSYSLLLAYALAVGTVVAFVQPARDGMLNQVAGGQLQKTVTITMGLTFGAQIFGYVAASFADITGPVPLLCVHGGIMFLGAFASAKLAPSPVVYRSQQGTTPLDQALDGIRLVMRSPRMGPALALTMAMSFFYGGSFMVLNPLIVRDVYQGSAGQLSMAFSAFVVGTVTATVLLVAGGGIARHGRALMLALVIGGLFLVSATLALSFYFYLLALMIWGGCGGVAMSMSRTIMQESAPEEYRARVLSVFSLGNLGGMPVGALLLGYAATLLGPLDTLWVSVGGVWLVVLVVSLASNLWTIEHLEGDLATS